MTKNFIINTVKHTTFWAMTCLIALIMTGCGGSDSGNDSASLSHTTIPLDHTMTTAPDSSGIQEPRPYTPPQQATVDDYEDGLMEADALAEEDRVTGHPGHHADDYGDSNGDNEDYDEGWEDGYDF
jgi:hypothetical protein